MYKKYIDTAFKTQAGPIDLNYSIKEKSIFLNALADALFQKYLIILAKKGYLINMRISNMSDLRSQFFSYLGNFKFEWLYKALLEIEHNSFKKKEVVLPKDVVSEVKREILMFQEIEVADGE